MSRPVYSVSINDGAEVSAESLGLQLRQRVRGSLRTDSLSVSVPRGMGRPMPVQPDDKVQVFCDGQPFFAGRADEKPSFLLSDGSHSAGFQILGPWAWLESWPALRDVNPVYAQASGIPAVEDDGVLTGYWDLFREDNTIGGLMSTGEQAVWAIMPVEFRQRAAPEFTLADIPAGQTPPNYQSISNITVAEVLRLCNRWNPAVGWWMDYSTTPPTLRAMPAEPITLGGGISNYWVGIDRSIVPAPPVPDQWTFNYYVHSEQETALPLSIAPGGVATFRGAVRNDMVPSVVTVRGNSGWTQYPAGVSVNNRRAVWLQRAGSTPPTAIVEYLYRQLATPRLEGSVVINTGTGKPYVEARPGRVWDLQGDDIATGRGVALATTQLVTDDLVTGLTTCELGLPRHLGLGEMLSLTVWARLMG